LKTKKLKKLIIKVITEEQFNRDVIAAWNREYKTIMRKNEIGVHNINRVGFIFSQERLELIQAIKMYEPESIYELAKLVERDFKNVSKDVTILASFGMIGIEKSETGRKSIKPILLYSGYEVQFAS
jgi:predicted transcriptional regulator